MRQSALLTTALVEQALSILRPSIEGIIKIDPVRMVACSVVLNPIVPCLVGQGAVPPVLWQGFVGEENRNKWPNPYNEFALAKAQLSWRTGLPSHLVQRDRPFLFEGGDFKFGGSIVFNGIVVATSGLAWHHDLWISGMIASACYALSIGAFEAELARKPYFVGQSEPGPGAPDSD